MHRRYMAAPQIGEPLYFRSRTLARFVAWYTGWKFIPSNEQGTM